MLPRSRVSPAAAAQTGAAPTGSCRRPPLPYDQVDEIVRKFYEAHPMLWTGSVPRHLREHYSPTGMPAHSFQNAADSAMLQHQAEVHMNVAALLSAFAFAAAAAEGALSPSGESTLLIDQAIFITLCLATVLLLGTVLHFLYIDMGLGTKGGRRYWQAYSAKLGTSCVSFHLGCWILIACFPMWAYRKFGLQPGFFATLVFAVLWPLYDMFPLLGQHNHMNQILAHADLGIDFTKTRNGRNFLTAQLNSWTSDAWEAMRAAHFADEAAELATERHAKNMPVATAAAVM